MKWELGIFSSWWLVKFVQWFSVLVGFDLLIVIFAVTYYSTYYTGIIVITMKIHLFCRSNI